ncbi:hypothetical protein NL676_029360 [Syzygium grande]|nr:hypothetical protein NL676_029360 [Syzygium grande]
MAVPQCPDKARTGTPRTQSSRKTQQGSAIARRTRSSKNRRNPRTPRNRKQSKEGSRTRWGKQRRINTERTEACEGEDTGGRLRLEELDRETERGREGGREGRRVEGFGEGVGGVNCR